jgi:UDP-3-O-[3-hydroxymyristoyl] N-acetylglucosamine deacetylase
LAAPVELAGIGLHSGSPARLRIEPAPTGTGLVFRRADLPGSAPIPALASHVCHSYLSTTLAAGGATVQTVEHVLAALWGLGITDAWLLLDGPEAPGQDGSCAPLVALIERAGVCALEGRRHEPVLGHGGVAEGERSVTAVPAEERRLTLAVDYGHPAAGPQVKHFVLTPEVFAREIAPARTFCLAAEAEAMRAAGLAKGGSYENAVVFGPDGPSSPLRFADEPVRHKALDLVGDLALLGVHWRGHVVAVKAGHGLHVAFAQQALARIHKEVSP